MTWGLAAVFGAFVFVGRCLALPDPSVHAYLSWLVWSGGILGVLTGLWSGQLLSTTANSVAGASLGAAAVGGSLMVAELAAYGILLPDFLMLPPGQVPQDNFDPWLMAGFYGLPLSVAVSLLSGWLFWPADRR